MADLHCDFVPRVYRLSINIYRYFRRIGRVCTSVLVLGHLADEFGAVGAQASAVSSTLSTVNIRKNFFDDLSNSVRPFDYIVKAGQLARPKT